MAENQNPPAGPDLALGVSPDDFKNDMLLGHVGEQDVLLVRAGAEIFAIDAHCSHYHGPLADGLVAGDGVRCPWHHACFDLRTGEAVRAPALSPLSVLEGRAARAAASSSGRSSDAAASREEGAGGCAAPDRDRRRRRGRLCRGGDAAARGLWRRDHHAERRRRRRRSTGPNLSKDYLAGSAPEDWMPLRPDELLSGRDRSTCGSRPTSPRSTPRRARSRSPTARPLPYDRLLLATGAEPVRLPIPGADQPHVHTLRSLADSRAIIANAQGRQARDRDRRELHRARGRGRRCARATSRCMSSRRKQRPMERVLGPDMGDFVRALHEEHGVIFHLGDTVAAIDGKRATLKSGGTLEADLVVVGVGVRPRLALAEQAGLADRPRRRRQRLSRDQRARHLCRRRHRALARSAFGREHPRRALGGGASARARPRRATCSGMREAFDAVPFFWSQHYDVPINYVGHAEQWDEIAIDGDIKGRDCVLRYKQKGRVLAVASIYRDVDSLKAELAMEKA